MKAKNQSKSEKAGMHWKARGARQRPATVPLTPSASFNGVCNRCNRPQPLSQPPPTAYPTAAGAASAVPSPLMHPYLIRVVCGEVAEGPAAVLLHARMRLVVVHGSQHHRDPALQRDLDLVVVVHREAAEGRAAVLLEPGVRLVLLHGLQDHGDAALLGDLDPVVGVYGAGRAAAGLGGPGLRLLVAHGVRESCGTSNERRCVVWSQS